MTSKERKFLVNGYQLMANEWHEDGEHKVIALHGWLDNAASFDRLAPLLYNCHLVALDAPGHGLSDHKSPQATYNIWDDLLDILAVADQLNWHDFTLVGHSRGAIISVLLAAAAPARIKSLVLLDGIWAQGVKIEDTAKQLAQFIEGNRAAKVKKGPVYRTVEAAVDMRSQASSMCSESARLIVERGLKLVDGGFTWRTDPRLLTASAFKMTDQHNHALMDAVAAPILLLLAEQGLGANPLILQQVKQYSLIEHQLLPGSHHFHMEQPAEDIAERIIEFLCDANAEESK
jgi:pimeloyl-ACP methyl ester carboxylesterase